MLLEPVSQKQKENSVLIFDENMTSVKPYLIQAIYDWISDNNLTPLVVVDVNVVGVKVPPSAIEDGKVVLNISMSATQGMDMDDEVISFSARFSGRPQMVVLPMAAVTAIYARENSKGMMFDIDQSEQTVADDSATDTIGNQSTKKAKQGSKPHLKLVD